MPITYVQGDPLLTRASTLAFGMNARGRIETDTFSTRIMQVYPAAFSSFTRRARRDQFKAGQLYFWSEAMPRLLFLIVRDSSVGATRLRYVQSVLMTIARDYPLFNLHSLAIAPLGTSYEQGEILKLIDMWLRGSRLPVTVYEKILPGVAAEQELTTR
jgi:hypothetical protein